MTGAGVSAGVAEAAAVDGLVARMCREFEAVSAEQVRDHVLDIYADFADAPVQAFVPVLVEKRLRQLLRTSARPLHAATG